MGEGVRRGQKVSGTSDVAKCPQIVRCQSGSVVGTAAKRHCQGLLTALLLKGLAKGFYFLVVSLPRPERGGISKENEEKSRKNQRIWASKYIPRSNSARKSMKIFWAQTFSTRSSFDF